MIAFAVLPLLLAGIAGGRVPPPRALRVDVAPSASTPARLGTLIRFDAMVTGADAAGPVWYRFAVRDGSAGEPRVIRDFGPEASLEWTASDHEGTYYVEVSARKLDSGLEAAETLPVEFSALTGPGGAPVVTPTAHPLVFLYSAPGCPDGAQMLVEFAAPEGTVQRTPAKGCAGPGRSMNFYVAGLRPHTSYTAWSAVGGEKGPALTITTGGDLPALAEHILMAAPPATGAPSPILLHATIMTRAVATDLVGNVVWYYPGDISFITRPSGDGRFLGVVENERLDAAHQVLREFDVTGMTVAETNAARVSEQLVAMGMRPITGFHHEARRLANGGTLALAGVEQMIDFDDGQGPVDVLGDMIVVLDAELNVVWTWDAFDHLDVNRKATLNDWCAPGVCPPHYLSSFAVDWLHGNAVDAAPDGNLLYSSRSQDWLIKIDFQNGAGSGEIIWKLGKDGDFTAEGADGWPWFSHQHDGRFEPGSLTRITVFDNGNTRQAADPAACSRGQVWEIDEERRVARLILNADMGRYSFALGSAALLPNGNHHFNVGFLSDATSLSVDVNAAGEMVYALETRAPQYRSFRLRDLYSVE